MEEIIELEIDKDFTITVKGTFDEGEKGDRNHPNIPASFRIDEYSTDNQDDLEDYKTGLPCSLISHLEDLCLDILLA